MITVTLVKNAVIRSKETFAVRKRLLLYHKEGETITYTFDVGGKDDR